LNTMLPLEFDSMNVIALGDVPKPLAVTVPLIMTLVWDQDERVMPPLTSVTRSEGGLLPLWEAGAE
jgi:hypothetical protein